MAIVHLNEHAAPAVQKLEDGTTVYRTSAWAPPGCHGVGCGLKVWIDAQGDVKKVEGDPDHPITHGKLCPRCLALKDFYESDERLLHPLKRDPEKRGQYAWERCSWDEAYDLIEKNYREVVKEWGYDAVGVFAGTGREGGRYHFVFALDVFQTQSTIETISGWSCIIPRMAGMSWILGAPYAEIDNAIGLPGTYDNPEWVCPKYILNWGRDPLRSNPDGLWGHSLVDMMRRGAKLINVDPRVNWLSTRAEVYLQVRPGTDCAVAMAILNEIIQSDCYDHEFVESWIYGFDQLAERVKDWTPERAAEIADVNPDDIRRVAQCLLEKPCTLSMGLAVDQSVNSIQLAHSLLAIMAITGNIDIPGGLYLGQPLRMFQALQGDNTIEDAQESELPEGFEPLPPHDPTPKPGIGHEEFPALPTVANTPHPDVVLDCLETDRPQPLKMAYMLNTNILACMPAQPKRWMDAMRKMQFVVCADLFMTPTTMAFADLILPVCSSIEHDGIVMNNQASMWGQLGALNNIAPRRGDTKSDLEIAIDLHKRLHPEDKDPKWNSVSDYLTNDLRPVDDCNLTFPELKEQVMCQYELEYRKYEKGLLRDDGKPGFRTRTGRIELWSTHLASLGYDPLPYYIAPPLSPVERPDIAREYPLTLVTGARQFVSFHSEHRQIRKLREIHPYPEVQINPATAASYGITDGAWVYIENEWGRVKMVAKLTPIVKEDVISADHGWWYPEANPEDLFNVWDSNVNSLMPHKVVGPTGFGAPYKCLPAKIYLAQ